MNQISFDKQIDAIAALTEGMSIRSVSRLTGIHRDTIMRLGVRIGQCCDQLHDQAMINLRPSVIQVDELWAYIAKKQKRVKANEAQTKGDFYTFLALDRHDKAILSYHTGKRNSLNTGIFIADLRERVIGAPAIFSDGWAAYKDAIEYSFGRQVHYGQLVKHYGNVSGSVQAARRYSPADVISVKRRPVFGRPNPDAICTSHVERQNLSLRMASRRFSRLTNGFSKKPENHSAAVGLYVAHHNFCRVHETIKTTPAIAMGVADHVWSIGELIEACEHVGPSNPLPTSNVFERHVGHLRVIDGGRK